MVDDDGTGNGPPIVVRAIAAAELAAPGGGGGCEIDILAPATAGTSGADWRIGRTVDTRDLQGKTVRVRMSVMAREAGTLPQGTAYVYDGRKVVGIPLQKVGPAWADYDIDYDVPADVDQIEIWFRLFFDTPVATPERNRLRFAASLLAVPTGAPPAAE